MGSTLNLTEQQAAAIRCRDVSVALSAGAGCGKTSVLTQRFLSHLEPGPRCDELHRLAAITFTDKAAREMRDRIRDACQQRLSSCPAGEVEHWLRVLRGLDAARVSTIHSFCTTLLRSHAVEAGIDPRFTVLERALADTLLQTTAADVVHRLLIADDPDAVAFVLQFGLDQTRSMAARLASQRFRMDWSRWENVTAEQLAALWRDTWQRDFVPRIVDQVRSGPEAVLLRKLLVEEAPEHPEMQRRCGELHRQLDPKTKWTDAILQLQAIREVARVQGGGNEKVWRTPDVYEVVKTALGELRKSVDCALKKLTVSSEDITLSADLAVRGVRLAKLTADAYAEAKHTAGALDFDDLLLLARDLLRDREDVRKRFAGGINLLLVDEFQDTDPVQAEIVRHLCGEALAAGRLFLVGDVKQSIYRFRRADPEVFLNLKQEISERGQLKLTENFRSQPAILSFVNLLFGPAFKEYEALTAHKNQQLSPLPCIEFLWATKETESTKQKDCISEESEDDPEESDDAPGRVSADELRQREADWIARRIAQLLADDTERIREKNPATGTTTLRRVQPGDITILFRALSNVAIYEAALREYGLDYYLVGGKAFYAQQEVFDLLNLCRCLGDRSDSVALVGILRSPFFGLSDDAIHALHSEPGDWWERLQQSPPAALPAAQRERIRFAATVLNDLHRMKDHRSIAELLTSAIRQTGYDAALLAEHLGHRKVANLRKLIEEAAVFDSAEVFTLNDFVQWLQTSVFAQTDEEFATTLPETGDVIRLMSVHQAKGLEFPVVIVADVNRKSPPGNAGAYLHPDWGALVRIPNEFGVEHNHPALQMLRLVEDEAEEQEAHRLFYVATTRAKDHLILSAGIEPDLKPVSPWMKLLADRFALDTGLPKGDPLMGTMAGAKSRREIPMIRVHREPPFASPVSQTREHRPLAEFASALENATPTPLPESTRRFAADPLAPRFWTPSQLEELAAQRFPELRAAHRNAEAGHFGKCPASKTPEFAEALGTLLHAVLERIDFAAPASWGAVMDAAIETSPKPLDAALIQLAREILDRFQDSGIARELAAAKQIWREFDFALRWPGRGSEPHIITGQVDCCFVTPAGTRHLIDFKTGDYANGESESEILAPYRLQLGLYALAAEQWWGAPLDSVELVVFRPEVRRVCWKFDHDAKRKLEDWVNEVVQ